MASRVFLSFVQEDLDLVNLFRRQARTRFFDCSVAEPYNSTNLFFIRLKIRERIATTSVTLCLVGRTTYASEWVDWEIRTSQEQASRIYGIRLNNQVWDPVPRALIELGALVVGWDFERIIALIDN
jgi:hypothetical protein